MIVVLLRVFTGKRGLPASLHLRRNTRTGVTGAEENALDAERAKGQVLPVGVPREGWLADEKRTLQRHIEGRGTLKKKGKEKIDRAQVPKGKPRRGRLEEEPSSGPPTGRRTGCKIS